jgi:hypothetical protein
MVNYLSKNSLSSNEKSLKKSGKKEQKLKDSSFFHIAKVFALSIS